AKLRRGLDLEAAHPRAAAIAEEEEVRFRLVPLDQVAEPVLVEVHGQLHRGARVAGRDVVLHARLRLEIRIARDEASARGTAIVAIRQHGIAERARDLEGQAESLERANSHSA